MPRNLLANRREQIQQAISTLTIGNRRRYPARLRAKIADYSHGRIAEGASITRVCSELGVSHPTMVRILQEKPAQLRRVRVVNSNEAKQQRGEVTVKGPGGLVIEGLDINGVAVLVRALS